MIDLITQTQNILFSKEDKKNQLINHIIFNHQSDKIIYVSEDSINILNISTQKIEKHIQIHYHNETNMKISK